MIEFYKIGQNETLDQFLIRIGDDKCCGLLISKWTQIAEHINSQTNSSFDESYYRKRYKRLKNMNVITDDNILTGNYDQNTKKTFVEFEQMRIRLRDERTAMARSIKENARFSSFLDIMSDKIVKYNSSNQVYMTKTVDDSDNDLIVMLSDIHYGLTFDKCEYNNRLAYNSLIAKDRVLTYAEHIKRIGSMNNVNNVHVFLMGDMVSGNIHDTIRIQNKENIIEQTIGVSELVSRFLLELSNAFNTVKVYNVNGNHSRLDCNIDKNLNGEKLDAIIPWYCKTKLEYVKNVSFEKTYENETLAVVDIHGKTYCAVHGDLDGDLSKSVVNISRNLKTNIDYMLAGHLHVADARMETVGYIRNGSVCGSGDEYTTKKRLYGPPIQVCCVVNYDGVSSIHPVKLN